MAVVPSSVNTNHGDYRVVTWGPLANGDSGEPAGFPGYSDQSIQVIGTFGAAGNVKIEGSNDGVNYVTLSDPQGSALDVATAKIKSVSEVARWIRPRVSAGDGTTALTVVALLKRTA